MNQEFTGSSIGSNTALLSILKRLTSPRREEYLKYRLRLMDSARLEPGICISNTPRMNARLAYVNHGSSNEVEKISVDITSVNVNSKSLLKRSRRQNTDRKKFPGSMNSQVTCLWLWGTKHWLVAEHLLVVGFSITAFMRQQKPWPRHTHKGLTLRALALLNSLKDLCFGEVEHLGPWEESSAE